MKHKYYCRCCHRPFNVEKDCYYSPTGNYIGQCKNLDCKDYISHQIIFEPYQNHFVADLYLNPYQPDTIRILNKSPETKESDLLPWEWSAFAKIKCPSWECPKTGQYIDVSFSLAEQLYLIDIERLRFLKLHRRRLKYRMQKFTKNQSIY